MKRGRGASAKKVMLRLVPLPSNPDFQGEGESIPYHLIGRVRFSLDFTRIRLFVPHGVVTIEGRNLKPMLDMVEESLEGTLVEVDPLQAAAMDGSVVTRLRLEELED